MTEEDNNKTVIVPPLPPRKMHINKSDSLIMVTWFAMAIIALVSIMTYIKARDVQKRWNELATTQADVVKARLHRDTAIAQRDTAYNQKVEAEKQAEATIAVVKQAEIDLNKRRLEVTAKEVEAETEKAKAQQAIAAATKAVPPPTVVVQQAPVAPAPQPTPTAPAAIQPAVPPQPTPVTSTMTATTVKKPTKVADCLYDGVKMDEADECCQSLGGKARASCERKLDKMVEDLLKTLK